MSDSAGNPVQVFRAVLEAVRQAGVPCGGSAVPAIDATDPAVSGLEHELK